MMHWLDFGPDLQFKGMLVITHGHSDAVVESQAGGSRWRLLD